MSTQRLDPSRVLTKKHRSDAVVKVRLDGGAAKPALAETDNTFVGVDSDPDQSGAGSETNGLNFGDLQSSLLLSTAKLRTSEEWSSLRVPPHKTRCCRNRPGRKAGLWRPAPANPRPELPQFGFSPLRHLQCAAEDVRLRLPETIDHTGSKQSSRGHLIAPHPLRRTTNSNPRLRCRSPERDLLRPKHILRW